MSTILLTGATGFIGTHLLKGIQQHPVYRSYELVLLSSKEISGCKTILHKNYSFTKNDFIEAGIAQVDIVLHAGASTPKKADDSNDIAKANSNIYSLQHLIEQLPNVPGKFIFLSTLDVYKPGADEIITETTVTEPASLYGWSKLYGEKMVEIWGKDKHVIVQILRIGHIYGSGEEAYQKLIPSTIRKVLLKQVPSIFSKGNELRSFLHITDCVNAILSAIEPDEYKGPINIVSGKAMSVREAVSEIVNAINPQSEIIIEGRDVPVRNLVFDNRKMQTYLTGEQMSFQEGIKEEILNFRL